MKDIRIEKSLTLREDQILSKYFSDIEKIPMITQREEIILSNKIKEGDKQALDKLVKSNLRFVVSVSKKYQGLGVPLIDLINEGNIGLIRAAKKFDGDKGFKFISYAVHYIRESILSFFNKNLKTIRLPSDKNALQSKIQKFKDVFEQQYHREPTIEEIEDHFFQINNVVLRQLLQIKPCLSLDNKINDDSDNCLVDLIENKERGIYSLIEDEYQKKRIELAFQCLKRKEMFVIKHLYGFDTDSKDVEHIADMMKLTPQRIRMLKDSGIKRMKIFLIQNSNKMELI